MTGQWSFTAAQWGLLTRMLELAFYPAPIEVNLALRGGDVAARELTERGLLHQGRVDANLEEALRVLARSESSVDAVWLDQPEATLPVRVLAARSGRLGVLATQSPDQPGATQVREVSANGLAPALIGQLPANIPGTSPAVTVPAEKRDNLGTGDQQQGVLRSTTSSSLSRQERDRRAAVKIVEVAHQRAGQIGANRRDRNGRERRSDVLRWFDNAGDGRYLMALQHVRDARQWWIAPADAEALGTQTAELLASVAT